ncbi:MAG: hypothetical protein E6Q48_04350 [Limnohabitans sp.]|nr:MAG: hypothetical protein E6Q48_04350 [Limnohabitans sp.]
MVFRVCLSLGPPALGAKFCFKINKINLFVNSPMMWIHEGRYRAVFVWLGMLMANVALASDLTLGQALLLAANEHPSVKAKLGELQAAVKDIDAARWGRFPSLSLQATSSQGQPQAAMVLQQPLWAGGRIDAQIRLSEVTQLQAEATLHETRQGLLLQTGSAFFEVLRLRARRALALKNEQEHKKLLEMMDRRVQTEISPVADQTLARARLQQAISDRIQLDRAMQNALLALDQLVGHLNGALKPPARTSWPLPDEPQMLEAAKENSGELRRLNLQLHVAAAQIDLAQSGLWPALSLMHRRALGGPGFVTQTARNQTFLSLDMSPGAGLSAAAQVDAAKARLDATRQAIDAYHRQLEQQVRNSIAEWQALQEQHPSATALVQATQDVVASYLRQYQIGRKNWLDVLNALRESVQAAYTATDIEYGMQSAQIRLMLYSGQLRLDNLDLIHD